MLHTRLIILAATGLLLAACQDQTPAVTSGSAVSPQLNSGVTATSGGGQRALGNAPSVSVGEPQGAITTGTPTGTSKGRAY